ncbi:hypothetical protein AFLA_007586 [Aspergillus flavus NRRL3357]|nr:hypothetical protein AFLA_007586 [Aspergillus flavus NRRL3357]
MSERDSRQWRCANTSDPTLSHDADPTLTYTVNSTLLQAGILFIDSLFLLFPLIYVADHLSCYRGPDPVLSLATAPRTFNSFHL